MAFANQPTNVFIGPQPRDLGGNTYQYETVQKGGRARKSRARKLKKAKQTRANKSRARTRK